MAKQWEHKVLERLYAYGEGRLDALNEKCAPVRSVAAEREDAEGRGARNELNAMLDQFPKSVRQGGRLGRLPRELRGGE